MTDQVKAVVRALEKVTEQVIVRLSLNVTANLVETTPVDTGWARANWLPAIGTPRLGSGSSRPDPSLIPGQAASQQAAIAKAKADGSQVNGGNTDVGVGAAVALGPLAMAAACRNALS